MALRNLFITVLLLALSSADDYRLPTVYSPSNYDVSLVLPSDIFTSESATNYTGTIAITFRSSEVVSEIVLHASATHLSVTSGSVNPGNIIINGTSINSTTEILTISLNDSLVANRDYFLTIAFDGLLSTTDMYGFYKSSYTGSNGTTYYLATTQFESTYARRAFPCFDEPSYKATFNISLTYPAGLKALGNGAGTSTSSEDNSTVTTVFDPTPKMSTYLVAFIISFFTCSPGNAIEETLPYQVCSRNETSSTRDWAVEVAPLVIDSLNSYLNINYSAANIRKLDQVAIPDFSAGAMENWGLITYRERALLYDPNETSNTYKQYIAAVIAHELAHQWFGNLVTCKWWSEIFLNEGFATFFEYFTTGEIYPDYQMEEQFVIKTLQYIFEADASNSEALRADASTPSEISARFSGVTYDKGGSVLRMVEHILGTTVWKSRLNTYLSRNALSSAEPDDLWTVLNENLTVQLPAENLSIVMSNWINYPGFPVLNVGLEGSVLTISQERFVFNNNTSSNVSWYVPITYTTSANTSNFVNTAPVAWLTPNENFTRTLTGNVSWIIVNNQQTGYYRVNYDSSLWAGLTAALKANLATIPEINRAQIVNDAFNLARGGYLTYPQVFNIAEFLVSEVSYIVWYPAFSGFEYLLRRVGENSTLGRAVSAHILNLTDTLIATVPISATNDSNHIYTLNLVQAQGWACKIGVASCTDAALQLFGTYRNTSSRPNKNLRSIVYCYGLKHSTDIETDWEFLWNAFLSTSLSTEQVTILAALGCSSNSTILNSYLQKTLTDDSGVRSQDYASVFSAVYRGSHAGVDVALDFFTENYNAIISRYTSMNGVGNILKGIAEEITTDAQIVKLQSLISSNSLNGTVLEAANSALASAQNNYAWVNTYRSDLYSYYELEDEVTTTSATPNTTTSTPTTTPETTTPGDANRPYVAFTLMMLGAFVIMF